MQCQSDMESRTKIFGHSVHRMLVGFPITLLFASVVCDLVFFVTDNVRWNEISYGLLAAGIVTGLLAAPFGWRDWWVIPKRTRARQVGLVHGITNVIVLIFFGASAAVRYENILQPNPGAYILSFCGILLLAVAGWLGGELVERMGLGVDTGAHLNAPNSITHQAILREQKEKDVA